MEVVTDNIESRPKEPEHSFKVGDIVIRTNSSYCNCILGRHYIVDGVDSFGGLQLRDLETKELLVGRGNGLKNTFTATNFIPCIQLPLLLIIEKELDL